jgi:hypothetical protein
VDLFQSFKVILHTLIVFPGWSIEKLQHEFFLHDLPFRPDSEYLFHKAGLAAAPGTIVLFQFRGFLVASAALMDVRRFEKPRVGICDGERFVYEGALYFEPTSSRIFEPVAPEVVSRIWPEFTGFGQVKHRLDPSGYATLERELRHVERPKA